MRKRILLIAAAAVALPAVALAQFMGNPGGAGGVASAVSATQSGTWTVQPGNTANTTAWKVDGSAVTQPTSLALTTTGGWTPLVSGSLTNSAVAIKASAGELGQVVCYNPNASAEYVQIFNVAAASVTLGVTAPTYVIPMPATENGGFSALPGGHGLAFGTAISYAATTTYNGSTAPGTAVTCSVAYN